MSESDILAEINGVKPKVYLKDGDTKEAKSQSSDTTYRLRRTGDHFYCTCPAWRNQSGPVNGRTCKHLKELLGERYEKERMKMINGAMEDVRGSVRGKRKAVPSNSEGKAKGKRVKKEYKSSCSSSSSDVSDSDAFDGFSLAELEKQRNSMFNKLYKLSRRISRMKKAGEDCDVEEEDEDLEMKDEEDEDEEASSDGPSKRVRKGRAANKATITGKGKKKASPKNDNDDDDNDDDENDEDDDDEEIVEVNGVGSKKKPALLLAEKWDLENGLNPTDWWMSEKLDGVRAYWNGEYFMSREGNKFYAPDWFIKKFPTNVTLDGEFFAGRGTFQEIVSIVKTQGQPDKWKFKVNFCAFDVPSMGNEPFEARMEYLKKLFTKLRIKWVTVCEQTQVKSKEHLLEELKKVQDDGGEGLMLREPESLYHGRRSKTLLKVKTFHDADAEVLGYEGGKGRNTGVVGAIKCRMLDGGKHEFKVGTGLSDKDRRNPPKIGTTIIYRYFELTKSGVPRFPSFVGERAD